MATRPPLAEQFIALIEDVRSLAEPLGRERFNRRPAEDKWSVGENIEHLNVGARLYQPMLAGKIAEAREEGHTGGKGDGRTLYGRLVAWSQEPPVRFKFRTFKELEPAQDLDPDATVAAFDELFSGFREQWEGIQDLDLKRIRVRSMLDARLTMSLGDWYAFLAAHGRRHVWQARNVLRDLDVSR